MIRTHCLPNISTQQLQTPNIRVTLLSQLDDDFTLLNMSVVEVEVDDVNGSCIVKANLSVFSYCAGCKQMAYPERSSPRSRWRDR